MCKSFTEVCENSRLNDTIKHGLIMNATCVKINQQHILEQEWSSLVYRTTVKKKIL